MMVIASLIVMNQAAPTAADFFPLVPGSRRIYEEKAETKLTVIDEVGAKPVFFNDVDDKPAFAIIRKNRFNQIMDTTYYRVDGGTVSIVGYGEDRRASTPVVGQPIDVSKGDRKNVLMRLQPSMPVFKFEGGPTQWTYTEIPKIQGPAGEDPVKGDETSIVGTSKLGPERTVLGKKVGTLLVHTEAHLGLGKLERVVIEDSVYGQGLGLIETKIKSTVEKKSSESRSTLVGMEEKREGG